MQAAGPAVAQVVRGDHAVELVPGHEPGQHRPGVLDQMLALQDQREKHAVGIAPDALAVFPVELLEGLVAGVCGDVVFREISIFSAGSP
jgi:hypothetical protein